MNIQAFELDLLEKFSSLQETNITNVKKDL